jgi:phage terminase small subunit
MKNLIQTKDKEIPITEKEALFCNYYLSDANRNATEAAKLAGYSKSTARQQGSRMLSKVDIQLYLKEQSAPLMEALGITQERILRRLRDLAFTDLSDLTDDNWNLLPKSEIHKDFHAALNSVEIEERIIIQEGTSQVINRKTRFKLKEQQKALQSLAEMAGIMPKNAPEPVAPVQQITMFNQINKYIEER